VKRGKELGVATPVNDLFYALLVGVDQARLPLAAAAAAPRPVALTQAR
jgi:hypothetical protein